MLSISKAEISSLLNILREIRDGSEPSDLEQDVIENIEMLEAILGEDRMEMIGRNGGEGLHYEP